MRVVLTGGGTGGHIYPALAVAREIARQVPGAAFLYVGTGRGMEANVVPRNGLAFEEIEIAGFKRKLTWENVRTMWKFFRAVHRSKQILSKFQPDVVVGTGGYVCGPVVFAASLLGIPALIHEQNVVPGLANKFLARFATRIAVSFEESLAFFPREKVAVTGNPCATEVMYGKAEKGRESLGVSDSKRIVLIVGGSRGARPINDATRDLIPRLADFADCHFVYVTGEVHYAAISQELETWGNLPANLSVRPYIHNMPDVLAATHLIVNRAGASTLAEITALGIPSILIPSPYVTNNHQEKNARSLERAGAAFVLLERELTGDSLFQAISSVLADDDRWKRMRSAALALGKPDAAKEICRLLVDLA